MKKYIILLKVLLCIGSVCLVAAPLFFEYLSFRKDRKKKISYKRFRLVVFAAVYVILTTVLMTFLKDLYVSIRSLPVIVWICNHFAIPARITYGMSVIAVLMINFAIGLIFKFLLLFVRIGLKKKNLVKPKRKDGTYSLGQKIERAVLRFFHDEKWFFAGLIIKFLCITLSIGYSVLFVMYQLPIYFGADWIPYDMMQRIFNAAYGFPILTLIPLCELYFFLAGVELLEKECPEVIDMESGSNKSVQTDIQTVNTECQKLFKDYFRYQLKDIGEKTDSASSYHEVTRIIASGVELDQRNPKSIGEGYLKCLDVIVKNDMRALGERAGKETSGVLVNGGFFTEFSMYFLRFVSSILARGDNVIFVCNDDIQIKEVTSYVTQAFSRIYSLFQKQSAEQSFNFDDPIWRICAISGDKDTIERSRVNDCSVLVTDLKFLCSSEFETHNSPFAHLVDTVVFIDTVGSVNSYARLMAMFDASMKHVRDLNDMRSKNGDEDSRNERFQVRYTSTQIKYICFDDSRTPGIDRVLKNLLSVEFLSADAMRYAAQTIVCCYNYEGKPNEDGMRVCPQSARTREELGVLVNMADFALAFGAGKVSLFADGQVAYEDISESLAANANNGLLAQNGKNLAINSPFYNSDDYRVVIAFDTEDNLPAAVRRYASMMPEMPTLVMLFSRPYLLRDYYVDSIDSLWAPEQIMRIPIEQSSKKSVLDRILVRANAGGISGDELLEILRSARIPEYDELLEQEDLNRILRQILSDCGITLRDSLELFSYFEYDKVRAFDKNGNFVTHDKIRLRHEGMLYEMLSGKKMIRLSIEGSEAIMPIPVDRMTQNFIAGQNVLYNGSVYTIRAMDTAKGMLYVKHETGGRNDVPYQYLQDREYHIFRSDDTAERVYPTKHVVLGRGAELKVKDVYISVYRLPMEVLTKGYTPIDHRTLAKNGVDSTGYIDITGTDHLELFKQTYRKYGTIDDNDAVCSSDMIMNSNGAQGVNNTSFPEGALVMSVKLTGEFGKNARRISALAAAILGETLHSMFPSVADSIAVCPVISEPFTDEEAQEVLSKQPKVFYRGYGCTSEDIELLIIEDCASDLGVIAVLMSSGDDVLRMLFSPIHKYMQWYASQGQKSDYLYYGLDHEPSCFDFEGLTKLARILGEDNSALRFVDVEETARYDTCDFCGKRFIKGSDIVALDDGRMMCKNCSSSLVGNDKKALKAHLDRAKIFLESTYGISLDDEYVFCFESTVKIANSLKRNGGLRRGADHSLKSYIDNKKTVHIEYLLPSVNLSELLVRELTHVWQLKYLPDIDEELAEGHIALVSIQYLRFLNQSAVAAARTSHYESSRDSAGTGYRKLVRGLLASSQFNNNPFRYLLETSGMIVEDEIVISTPSIIDPRDYGLPYKPKAPDRALDGNIKYFYYSRLTATCRRVYDSLLAAIKDHEEKVVINGCSFEDVCKVSDAIAYDHPELFWYKTLSMAGSELTLFYGCSAEEAEVLQRRIDEVADGYLDDVDDSMSAYDVALRVHAKVIASVDYDTIALNKQHQEGGPAKDKIDYLRTICGVFLEGKAVCEGYARAIQYLLQKYGIECAEVAGHIRKETGARDAAHAWNILKVDGDYYYMDTTWDDSSNTIQTVKKTDLGFNYFCITTEELTRTRQIDLCPTEMPKCTETRANYYYHNALIIDKYDVDRIKSIAQAAAKSKNKAFTFKCRTKSVFEMTLDRLCAAGQDCYEALKAAARIDKSISPTSYSYIYDKNIWSITVKFKYK